MIDPYSPLYFALLFLGLTLLAGVTGCASEPVPESEDAVYTVTRIDEPVRIDNRWEKEPWNRIPSLRVDNHMGEEPEHRPVVEVKAAYDNEAIYVIYRVEDQYVRCAITDYQGPVFRDSCVEFFFTPATDVSRGYFNLETNCIGTALFHFQREPRSREGRSRISPEDFDRIEISSSMEEPVDPEITDPVTWTLEYRIPFDILENYFDIERPAPGVEWRANFYKCADDTSHPHWLTWSVVDHPVPDFHRPDYFGTLRFE